MKNFEEKNFVFEENSNGTEILFAVPLEKYLLPTIFNRDID